MTFYLVVDEQLETVQDYNMGEYYFTEQKNVNQVIMQNWKGGRGREIGDFITEYRGYCKDKMVIQFTDRESDQIMFNAWHSNAKIYDEVQKRFNEIKSKMDVRKCVINSLSYYIDIALRRVIVQDFYRRNVVPKLTKTVLDLNDKNSHTFHIKTSGWGYIAAYKHKVVMEFVNRPCYWIRLIHSRESLDLVEQNLTKNENNRIFLGSETDIIRYVDIFTSDADSAHLLELIAGDNIKAINVNLTPMMDTLKQHELFYAVENYKKIKPTIELIANG